MKWKAKVKQKQPNEEKKNEKKTILYLAHKDRISFFIQTIYVCINSIINRIAYNNTRDIFSIHHSDSLHEHVKLRATTLTKYLTHTNSTYYTHIYKNISIKTKQSSNYTQFLFYSDYYCYVIVVVVTIYFIFGVFFSLHLFVHIYIDILGKMINIILFTRC